MSARTAPMARFAGGDPGLPRRPAESGFSLVEALIATALVVLALAFAARLLVDAQRALTAAGWEQRDPLPALALARLRLDVRSAAAVVAPPWADVGSDGPLVLTGDPSGAVRWELAGDDLVRTVSPPGAAPRAQRVLGAVTGWRWRLEGPGLVAVQIGHRRHRATLVGAMAGPRPAPPPGAETVDTAVVALRARPRVRRW